MRTVRVYSETPLSPTTLVNLHEDAARHVARVLRMRAGDTLVLFDGNGAEYPGTIHDISKKSVSVQLGKADQPGRESPLQITLWHGICRGGKMDYVVQKATELGVRAIQPVFTTRGQFRFDSARAQKRSQHWQKVAISAAEQSGRTLIPEIYAPLGLNDCLQTLQTDFRHLLLDPTGTTGFTQALATSKKITIFTGPEGGFTTEELATAREASFEIVSLGPRVLRTETAPVVALGIAQSIAGDLGDQSGG
jgi:16S rRNA (uracil1498-N3)-methyltransferase